MADVTQNSYVESNDFFGVVFQKGRDVMDYELNEAQRNVFGKLSRAACAIATYIGPEATEFLHAADDAFLVRKSGLHGRVVVTGIITPGSFVMAGGAAILAPESDIGLVLPSYVAGEPARTDTIFLDISESEVDDPSEVLANNSKRSKLEWALVVYPGGVGVPTTDTRPIWAGGHHYYKIADVHRITTLGTVISTVYDRRRVLPQKALSKLVEFAGQEVSKVYTPRVQTPLGATAAEVMVLASATHQASPTDGGFRFEVGSGADILAELRQDGTSTTLSAPGLHAKSTSGSLELSDTNTTEDVRFSDGEASGKSLIKWPIKGSGPIPTAASLVRAVNNRSSFVVGNGTTSFGVLNTAYLGDVFTAMLVDAIPGRGHVTLLEGDYVVDASHPVPDVSSVLGAALPGNRGVGEFVLDGKGAASIHLSEGSDVELACPASSGGFGKLRIVLRGLTFYGNDTSVLTLKDANFVIEDCQFIGVQLVLENPKRAVGFAGESAITVLRNEALVMRNCFLRCAAEGASCIRVRRNVDTASNEDTAVYLFDRCDITRMASLSSTVEPTSSCVIVERSGGAEESAALLGPIVFKQCSLSNKISSAGKTGTVAYKTNHGVVSVVSPDAGIFPITVSRLSFEDCTLAGSDQVLKLNPNLSSSDLNLSVFGSVEIRRSTIECSRVSSVFAPVFISPTSGMGLDSIEEVLLESVEVVSSGSYDIADVTSAVLDVNQVGLVTIRAKKVVLSDVRITGRGKQSIPDLVLYGATTTKVMNTEVLLEEPTTEEGAVGDAWPTRRIILEPEVTSRVTEIFVDGLRVHASGSSSWLSASITPYESYATGVYLVPATSTVIRRVVADNLNFASATSPSCFMLGGPLFSNSAFVPGKVTVEDCSLLWGQGSGMVGRSGGFAMLPYPAPNVVSDLTLKNVRASGMDCGVNIGYLHGTLNVNDCYLKGTGTRTDAVGLYVDGSHAWSDIHVTGGRITAATPGTTYGETTINAVRIIFSSEVIQSGESGPKVYFYGVETSDGDSVASDSTVRTPRYRRIHIDGVLPADTSGKRAVTRGCETGMTTEGYRTFTNDAPMLHNGAKLYGVITL